MKRVIIGVDIGNATTEITIAQARLQNGVPVFLKSGITETTGTKGTVENVTGIQSLLSRLIQGEDYQIECVLVNDATPVIADFAMDTITETIITDSAMIGHNPDTPGGVGVGTGVTCLLEKVEDFYGDAEKPDFEQKAYIVVIPESQDFSKAAEMINQYEKQGHQITGAIVQKDEGTLIHNRLHKKIPIVDEVTQIEEVPLGMPCAVEVAAQGHSVDLLSNPYGIASVFGLDAAETDYCKYVAKALIGTRSAVVIKTPSADITARVIPAGTLRILGDKYTKTIAVDSGAKAVMDGVDRIGRIVDVTGEPGTNIGGMFETIKTKMAESCGVEKAAIKISDIFAADSYTAVPVKGGLAGECAMETGVAIAAMVRTNMAFMEHVSQALERKLGAPVVTHGIEGEMALKGVLTTPGAEPPLVMVDIGAGSTDAAYLDTDGTVVSAHLAGAGNLITTLIDSELNLNSFETAETIKKYPLAKVDNLYRIRYENGDVQFFEDPLPARYFGQITAVSTSGELHIIDVKEPIEKIRAIRRRIKRKVIVENVKRALLAVGVDREQCRRIILVGGAVLDFELSNILTEEMDKLRLTAGKANIRGTKGPRNAVATGLIMDYLERSRDDAT